MIAVIYGYSSDLQRAHQGATRRLSRLHEKEERDFVHISVATAETFSAYLEAFSNTPHGTLNFFVSLASGVVWVLDEVYEDWVQKSVVGYPFISRPIVHLIKASPAANRRA